MNTYRIYEDFKATLGDAAAQSLAKTLGTMFDELKDTVTKEDFRILRESMDANVSRLDTAITRLTEAQARTEAKVGELAEGQTRLFEAQARTEAKVAELAEGQSRLFEAQARTEQQIKTLAEAQARTEQQIKTLAEAQARTEQQIKTLAEAQARTEAKVAELAEGQTRLFEAQARTEQQIKTLAEAQARTEQQVRTLAEGMQRLTARTDMVIGDAFEIRFRDRLTAYLGRFLRRGKVIGNDALLDAIEPHVTSDDVDEFLRADIVAKGLVDGVETYVVVEVSSTGDLSDVVRAERRAAILRKAGLAAIPLVACKSILPDSLAAAHRAGVRVWCDGSLVDAAA
jgi:myosin heavy subunit